MYKNHLYHHGILGMKWGVRRFQNEDGTLTSAGKKRHASKPDEQRRRVVVTTKNGEKVTIREQKKSKLCSFLSKISPRIAEEAKKSIFCDIEDEDNKKVGLLQLYKESEDSLNVTWLGTKNASRGKGYASAAMDAAIQIAKKMGAKQMTLEVPGDSPDARHIYEKKGFIEVSSPNKDDDDVWGD